MAEGKDNGKKRKPNFSETEKIRLIEAYEHEKVVLSAKFSTNVTSRKKHEAWQRIAGALNSRNTLVHRTVAEIQKKWQHLTSAMKDEYRKHRKESQKTGGGPPPNEPSIISKKIYSLLGEDDPSLYGIEGGIDSINPSTGMGKVPTPEKGSCNRSTTPTSPAPDIADLGTAIESPDDEIPGPSYKSAQCSNVSENNRKRKRVADGDADLLVLQKELLVLEKERATLEIEKLKLEKQKLALEIEILNRKKNGHGFELETDQSENVGRMATWPTYPPPRYMNM
ncbi:uncharacterized protein LOC135486754 [Lineus longissimus]|uniref:uncharacterized protein LOC135486754 n=1 Tax=Lineus longissimus TaxID=88925 RepID=UPI00315D6EA7